jgi:hypothetical protein
MMPDDPTPGHRYYIESKATGKRLGLTAEGVHGGIPAAFGLSEHELHVVPTGDGGTVYWTVEGADIGLRFNTEWDPNYRLDSNAERQVYFHPANDGAYQKWRPIPDGEGYWQLINVATGLALDGNPEDIYTMDPNDGAYQRWGFHPA